jgi:hypothetical protein
MSSIFFVAFRLPSGTGECVVFNNSRYVRLIGQYEVPYGSPPSVGWGGQIKEERLLAQAMLWELTRNSDTVLQLYKAFASELLHDAPHQGFVLTAAQAYAWVEEQAWKLVEDARIDQVGEEVAP